MANYNVGTTGIVVTADVEKAIAGLSKLKTTIDQVKEDEAIDQAMKGE